MTVPCEGRHSLGGHERPTQPTLEYPPMADLTLTLTDQMYATLVSKTSVKARKAKAAEYVSVFEHGRSVWNADRSMRSSGH